MKDSACVPQIFQLCIDSAIKAACDAIAPTWPLSGFIAVNPFLGWSHRSFDEVAEHLAQLSGTNLRMPREFYRDAMDNDVFDHTHLSDALRDSGLALEVDQIVTALQSPSSSPSTASLPLLTDVLDEHRDLASAPAWHETIAHQISQFCASYFDVHQADWHPVNHTTLFSSWRAAVSYDYGIGFLMSAPEVALRASKLPQDASSTIEFVLTQLGIPVADFNDFLTTVLLRINGWAAWCAYLRWQARLEDKDNREIVDLLAIRLAWEYLLDDGKRDASSTWSQWQKVWRRKSEVVEKPNYDVIFQRALEAAYQEKLAINLLDAMRKSVSENEVISLAPDLQALFCIDVRSEVFRRALETVAPDTQTMGFAGFFGLPISYSPVGSDSHRSQLPGLLAPTLCVSESCDGLHASHALAKTRRKALASIKYSRRFQRVPSSAFALVETLGIGYMAKIIKRALPFSAAPASLDHFAAKLPINARPTLRIEGDDALEKKISIALAILKNMNLGRDIGRIVLFVGHGSQSINNPHASGLDCGACCGQTGEVNARALALLLNDPQVRNGLAQQSQFISSTTQFVAALHNTTTDEVALFDTDLIASTHVNDVVRLRLILEQAGQLARAERAHLLGMDQIANQPKSLLHTLKIRGNDWSQTRPEWGLTNNASFIIAPRLRTRNINLEGRSFLHDYDWKADKNSSILELIMTAPMIVTHWINMQYYASTVDNRRYGSGNKVLHNVVGGDIGVFEGNGGDLRIGLPIQSLHDGEKWMHTPLRLSVYIEAPRDCIDMVMDKHVQVRNLVDNHWLYLFRIDTDRMDIERYSNGHWVSERDKDELVYS